MILNLHSSARTPSRHVAVLSQNETATHLGRDPSRRSDGEDGFGQRRVLGCIQYRDEVVLARERVEVFHLDPSGFRAFARGIPPWSGDHKWISVRIGPDNLNSLGLVLFSDVMLGFVRLSDTVLRDSSIRFAVSRTPSPFSDLSIGEELRNSSRAVLLFSSRT